jgi:hypothetical protein
MNVQALWDSFKKLMPEESTRVERYKRDGMNQKSLHLTMKDGKFAVFTLGASTFSYIKQLN